MKPSGFLALLAAAVVAADLGSAQASTAAPVDPARELRAGKNFISTPVYS
jgi:hypothetical protein